MSFDQFLPIYFFVILGVAMLLYVILDGFDLGIGLLLPLAEDAEKDSMIASQILREIDSRLGFLDSVGLSYLTLSRAAATLSGGDHWQCHRLA